MRQADIFGTWYGDVGGGSIWRGEGPWEEFHSFKEWFEAVPAEARLTFTRPMVTYRGAATVTLTGVLKSEVSLHYWYVSVYDVDEGYNIVFPYETSDVTFSHDSGEGQ